MKCFFRHDWGWPRKRGDMDIQVCLSCGLERESRVRFDGPRYTRTQDGIPNFSPAATAATVVTAQVRRQPRRSKIRALRSVA